MIDLLSNYVKKTAACFTPQVAEAVTELFCDLERARTEKRSIFICGNGGSAANALHWANDLIYGAGKSGKGGLRAHALPSNISVLTCLANDVGFEHVFSHQLETLASSGDILIALSGSGNSPNIVRALTTGRTIGLRTWSVLGFDGGRAIEQSDRSIHFEIHDMQVAEDCQMVVCHVLTKKLAGDEG